MKKILKSRKGGFTLVELLIVIMIIAILAGMMMLATGSATDSAEAAKLVNDLRAAKSACLLYFVDEGEWPSVDTPPIPNSLDKYCDRPMFDATTGKYDLDIVRGTLDGTERYLIGIQPRNTPIAAGVKAKLVAGANKSAVFMDTFPASFNSIDGAIKAGYIYMNMK
jgi:general secretion pathway protein G